MTAPERFETSFLVKYGQSANIGCLPADGKVIGRSASSVPIQEGQLWTYLGDGGSYARTTYLKVTSSNQTAPVLWPLCRYMRAAAVQSGAALVTEICFQDVVPDSEPPQAMVPATRGR